MAFWNKILKRKKEEGKTGKKQTPGAELEEKRETRPVVRTSALTGVLMAPHVTEKTTNAAKENKYVFQVAAQANKSEVKRAVESRYGVKAEAVNITLTHGKERRRGRIVGRKPGFKKAIITLKEGQKIEIQ